MGNNKTRTFRSSLKPDFNTEFKLMVIKMKYVAAINKSYSSGELIRNHTKNLSLVVAICDQDTDSRDDYMAGVSCVGISNNEIMEYYFRYELD